MTLDVQIGKIIIDHSEGRDKLKAFMHVKMCPKAKEDICDPKHTFTPREAFRSGSSGLWNFFQSYVSDLYFKWRDHPDSNDLDVGFIEPVINEILALKEPDGPIEKDRMHWLKYWCRKAVELYGKNAGIMFT